MRKMNTFTCKYYESLYLHNYLKYYCSTWSNFVLIFLLARSVRIFYLIFYRPLRSSLRSAIRIYIWHFIVIMRYYIIQFISVNVIYNLRETEKFKIFIYLFFLRLALFVRRRSLIFTIERMLMRGILSHWKTNKRIPLGFFAALSVPPRARAGARSFVCAAGRQRAAGALFHAGKR